jgi:hypothetical protein
MRKKKNKIILKNQYIIVHRIIMNFFFLYTKIFFSNSNCKNISYIYIYIFVCEIIYFLFFLTEKKKILLLCIFIIYL